MKREKANASRLTVKRSIKKEVRGVGFEPTNLYRIGASGLRL
jgi:hypothetical protein